MSGRGEADFSPSTIKLIAGAVNYQCSVPRCTTPAVGAFDGKAINGGTACHIYSAAMKGPRGRGNLSDQQLSDESNGLWCCAYHGRIIDTNAGNTFPAPQLHMWKRLAEGRIKRAMGTDYAELGWIHQFSLTIESRFSKRWTPKFKLGKNNVINGPNDIGKSLILQALGSITESRHAKRLQAFPFYSVQIEFDTQLHDSVAEASSTNGYPVVRKLRGKEVAVPSSEIAIMFLDPNDEMRQRNLSGSKLLTSWLGIDDNVLYALIRKINDDPRSGFTIHYSHDAGSNDFFDRNNDQVSKPLDVTFNNAPHTFSFGALGSGEQLRIVIALFIALAREEVKRRPVLICIDSLWRLDNENLSDQLRWLEDEPMQLLIVIPGEMDSAEISRKLPGWNHLQFPSIEFALSPAE